MLAVQLGRPAGHVAQSLDAFRQVVAHAGGARLAVVDRFELGELGDVRLDQVGELLDEALALIGRQARPAAIVEGAAGGGDGAVDVGVGRVDDPGDLLAGRGIEHRDRRAMRRIDPFAVDEQLRRALQEGLDRLAIGGLGGDAGHLVHRGSLLGAAAYSAPPRASQNLPADSASPRITG